MELVLSQNIRGTEFGGHNTYLCSLAVGPGFFGRGDRPVRSSILRTNDSGPQGLPVRVLFWTRSARSSSSAVGTDCAPRRAGVKGPKHRNRRPGGNVQTMIADKSRNPQKSANPFSEKSSRVDQGIEFLPTLRAPLCRAPQVVAALHAQAELAAAVEGKRQSSRSTTSPRCRGPG